MVKQMVKQSSENVAKKALQGVSFYIRKKKKTSDNSLIITRLPKADLLSLFFVYQYVKQIFVFETRRL